METTVTYSQDINNRSNADIKHEQLMKASTIRVYGEPLDYGSGSTFNIKSIKGGFFGIYDWCLCVQDTPDNPCPCGKNEVIWVPVKYLLASGMDEEKKKCFFDISKEADLQIEKLHSVKASDFSNSEKIGSIGTNLDRELVKKILELLKTPPYAPVPNDDNTPGVSEKSIIGSIKKLVEAFEIGFAIGKEVDKELDLSDKISDFLCKITGKC